MKTLYIVDGNSYAYRAFYAIPPLTAKDGVEVHAVFGFFNMLTKLIKSKEPDYMLLAFDYPGPTFRHKMFEEYKIHREKMPESLQAQMKMIKETAAAGGFKVFEMSGYEADDIIAAAATDASMNGIKTFILTGDKDMIQLVDKDISILKIGRDGEKVLTPKSVREELGIDPANITDVLALMGDASDNIPGVKGIGEKTAYKLVQEYGTAEEIVKKAASIKPERTAKLVQAGIEDIKISKQLAVLKPDTSLLKKAEYNLDDCGLEKLDRQALDAEFIKYNFKSLVSSEEAVKKEVKPAGKAAEADLDALEPDLKKSGEVTLIFCGNERQPELVLVSAAGKNCYVFGKNYRGLPDCLKGKKIITNSAKAVFSALGHDAGTGILDIMMLAYLLNPEKNYNDISHVFTEYEGGMYMSYEDVSGKGAKKIMIELADPGSLSDFASSVLEAAPSAAEKLLKKLKEAKMAGVYNDIEMPVAYTLSVMEKSGLKVDAEKLAALSKRTAKEIKSCEQKIYGAVGHEFNINSPKQLGEVLFEKLNLPAQKKTKTGYSTDSEVLSALEKMHPVVGEIIRNRMLVKLKTGFLDVVEGFLTKDGKIFPYYNQTVTATGRLSASEPNIQNMPVREEEGKEIREIFVPLEKKHVLIAADYSQIELRIMAHFSGDKKLLEAYKEGTDIHSVTASEIFGVKLKEVDDRQRRAAKTINFGIIYGISPFGLSKQLSIPVGEAGDYIDRFFATFPGVREYQEKTAAAAAKHGWVETLSGRRRYMANINSRNRTLREFAERAAVNMPIQGTAADIIKTAMAAIHKWLDKGGMKTKMIMQVHDELVFSSPADEKETVKKEIKRMMESAMTLSVPLVVDVGEGANWAEAK